MSEIIKCPFCDNQIESDTLKCSKCGALFTEPDLKGIKFKEFRIFLALQILTFGFFGSIWFLINYKAINNLVTKDKDSIKFNWLIILLGLNLLSYILYLNNTNATFALIPAGIQYLFNIALTYRALRIIQRYTKHVYCASIDFNPYYVVIFSVLYLVHYIDTYTDRVLNNHDYFDFKSPQGMTLIVLLSILAIILNFIHLAF